MSAGRLAWMSVARRGGRRILVAAVEGDVARAVDAALELEDLISRESVELATRC